MSFNPDKSKQAQEVIFSRKTEKIIHPPTIFNNMPVVCSSFEKHLGIYLDEKLNFSNHTKEAIPKVNKGLGILRKLYNVLTWNSLIIIYKSFIRPHLGYGVINLDQPESESFCKKIESVQYNTALAITWRWLKKLCYFYKIKIMKFHLI